MAAKPGGGFYLAIGSPLDLGPKTSPAIMPGFRAGSSQGGTIQEVSADGRSIRTYATGLRQPILDLASSGAPLFGTCAGMIVLAREIAGDEAPILPLLDVTVERNAFGRQLDSFETDLAVPVLGDQPVHGVFIRAPIIERTGPDVDILARLDDGRIVAVRERNIVATAFHPELAGETRFHRLVAAMASEHEDPGEGAGRRHHPTRRTQGAS